MFRLHANGLQGSVRPGGIPVAGLHVESRACLRPAAPGAGPFASPVQDHAPGHGAEQSRNAASGAPRRHTATGEPGGQRESQAPRAKGVGLPAPFFLVENGDIPQFRMELGNVPIFPSGAKQP